MIECVILFETPKKIGCFKFLVHGNECGLVVADMGHSWAGEISESWGRIL